MQRQTGFSMIEVLVTMLILSVGLLSIAALQVRGIAYSDEASMRSDMSILAYDIFDRMRLNTPNIADYINDFTVPVDCASNPDCNPSICNVSITTATNDLICWHYQVFSHLPPGAEADITRIAGSASGYEYSVEFSWVGRDSTSRSSSYSMFYKS